MNRLLEVGFEPVGHWFRDNEKIRFDISKYSTQKNILYAFVSDAQVMYIGKTSQALAARMAGYRNPANSQTTNIRNNRNIASLLDGSSAVEILVLPDNGLLHYGAFHINLAAALEDDLIRVILPKWNGGKVDRDGGSDEALSRMGEASRDLIAPAIHRFSYTAGHSYYNKGFFNVKIEDGEYFGSDREKIEVRLGGQDSFVLGYINRTANKNGTPRIMVGKYLTKWMKASAAEGDRVIVEMFSSTSIALSIAKV